MVRTVQRLISGAGVVVCLVLLAQAEPAAAAGSSCCQYQPAENAPTWLLDLDKGYGATIFVKAKEVGKCPALSSVVAVGPYAGFFDQPTGFDSTKNDCTVDTNYTGVAAALATNAATQCCVVMDGTTPFACVSKKKGSAGNCLEVASKSLSATRTVTRSDQECKTLDPCKALTDKDAAAKLAAQTKAASTPTKNALGEEVKQWTQEECLSLKDKNGNNRNMWLPPKSNPTATSGNHCYVKPSTVQLEVNLGDQAQVIHSLPQYINVAYKYAIGIAVLVAVIMLMYAGFVWMLSGVANKINEARAMMGAAATGLVLIFGAYVLLHTINPDLVQLKAPPIHAIRPEKFEVAGAAGAPCDPAEADSCKKAGANMRCQPTMLGVEKYCQQRTAQFMGAVFGSAAVVAAAPAAITAIGGAAANATATVLNQGVGTTIRSVAQTAGKEYVGDQIGEKVGKALAPALLAAAGAVYLSESPDVLGTCVLMNKDKTSGQICSNDGECKSGACLTTSKAACGLEKFGVCVEGNLRDACALDSSGENKKYGCKVGACVDNGRGPSKAGLGIGFCSDGSDIGMPCNSTMKCSSVKMPLECSAGYCRQAGYFDEDGVLIATLAQQPRCLIPSDCLPAGDKWKKLAKSQNANIGGITVATYAGCLKPPNPEIGLPARFLAPTINFKVGDSFFAELSSYGTCVIAAPKFLDSTKNPVQNFCYVNVRKLSSGSSMPDDVKKAVEKINTLFSGGKISSDFTAGVLFEKVGCGINKTSKVKQVSGLFVPEGDCEIDAGLLLEQNLTIQNGVGTVKGLCTPPETGPNNAQHVWIKSTATQNLLHVRYDDTFYGWIKTPEISELEYTFAGTVEQ